MSGALPCRLLPEVGMELHTWHMVGHRHYPQDLEPRDEVAPLTMVNGATKKAPWT